MRRALVWSQPTMARPCLLAGNSQRWDGSRIISARAISTGLWQLRGKVLRRIMKLPPASGIGSAHAIWRSTPDKPQRLPLPEGSSRLTPPGQIRGVCDLYTVRSSDECKADDKCEGDPSKNSDNKQRIVRDPMPAECVLSHGCFAANIAQQLNAMSI
jgi:hypothetical protein